MAIIFDGTDFGESAGKFVYQPLVNAAYEMPSRRNHFWGVLGEAVHYSLPSGRQMTMEVTTLNHASEAALRTHTTLWIAKMGVAGNLQIDGVTWPQVAFLKFEPSEHPFRDGSGQYGWIQRGVFHWQQIAT